MPSPTRILLTLLLLAAPVAAGEPPFATELSVGFSYEGSATDRPLVVLGGTATNAYDYSADARAHTLAVSATRWLSPVGDDGQTPFALLPYVARSSSVSASVALTGASRDSLGKFVGQETRLEVRVAGDRSFREADLAAEWFVGRRLAVRGGVAYGSERATDASTSLESPSGRADVSTAGVRSSGATGSLGVALRLGEHEVSATGSYGGTDLTREDASAFTGGAQPYFATLRSDGIGRKATLATRLLFLGRRLAVDASGSYGLTTSSSDLTTTLSGPYAQGRVLDRGAGLTATWFASRRLGLSAGFAYGSRGVSSGSPGHLRTSRDETSRAYTLRLRWFASARISAEAAASRSENVEISPPDSTTYQRFEEAVHRVTLGAVARF